jgi:hypothetical protein
VAAHFKTARALVGRTLSWWKLNGQRVRKKRVARTAPVVRLRVQQILHGTTWQSVPVVDSNLCEWRTSVNGKLVSSFTYPVASASACV